MSPAPPAITVLSVPSRRPLVHLAPIEQPRQARSTPTASKRAKAITSRTEERRKRCVKPVIAAQRAATQFACPATPQPNIKIWLAKLPARHASRAIYAPLARRPSRAPRARGACRGRQLRVRGGTTAHQALAVRQTARPDRTAANPTSSQLARPSAASAQSAQPPRRCVPPDSFAPRL